MANDHRRNQTRAQLEAAGFFLRTYAGGADELADAIRVIWLHMTNLDGQNLPRWEDATVPELVNTAAGRWERQFGGNDG